jgi:hypothetical protein
MATCHQPRIVPGDIGVYRDSFSGGSSAQFKEYIALFSPFEIGFNPAVKRIAEYKPTNEMVRRLIPGVSRKIVEAASDKEDHRYADTFSWHRLGQDDLSPGGT